MNNTSNAYKPLRSSQILQLEKFVSNIIEVLKEECVNPFDVNIPIGKLVNLSSTVALPGKIASDILSMRSAGEKESQKFRLE